MSKVKEKPILFSGEMVKALLSGAKSQTRRIVKPQPKVWEQNDLFLEWKDNPLTLSQIEAACPYGTPGQRLWVREAWRVFARWDENSGKELSEMPGVHSYPIRYEADGAECNVRTNDYKWGRYRHARFMPRWASRITLELTGVRVERLAQISEADAMAEGAAPIAVSGAEVWDMKNPAPAVSYRAGYCRLWESINGADSWQQNPFVWVLSFKRVSGE